MKNYNRLISSDNKGYASQYTERALNDDAYVPWNPKVLAAYAQTAEGDASPNTEGEFCSGTGDKCSYERSTCPEDPDDPTLCNSYGPNREHFADCALAGQKQMDKAMELWSNADTVLSGSVDYRHMWVNMSSVTIVDGEENKTLCRPAMGYSFGAGATDGPGTFPFTQGDTEGDEDFDVIIDELFGPSQQIRDCHAPKPILLPTGELDDEWPWQPEILPFQVFKIGQVVLVAVPAEFTTMAGRRLADRVNEVLSGNGMSDMVVIICGIANSFSSYVTTPEEYMRQRYEGASTTYGPNTLAAYLLKYGDMALAMALGESVEAGPNPPDLRLFPDTALDPIRTDVTPLAYTYGDIWEDVRSSYKQGEVANVSFVSGNPRNNLMTDRTFLEVQYNDAGNWKVLYTDAHWETKLIWSSNCHDDGEDEDETCEEEQESFSVVEWAIPANQQAGTYRLLHYGYAKYPDGIVADYNGVSSEFTVVSA